MTRWPVVPTLVVAIAVAAMIALGVWQLERRGEKAVAIARLESNMGRAPVAFPRRGTGDAVLFRSSSIVCLRPLRWTRESGRGASGVPGWRVIVECATGDGGADVPVQLGIARAFDTEVAWRGGRVAGYIGHAPSHRALISSVFDHSPKRLMLIAATPPAGLEANRGPDLSEVPNNHLAYAVQWFLFAGAAAVIYVLALRRRRAEPPAA